MAAIGRAETDTMSIVAQITSYLNPVKGTETSTLNIIAILALGLAFLAVSEARENHP